MLHRSLYLTVLLVWASQKSGTGKPLRVWSLLCERDKSRNSKLAAIRMAGAFVHWRQVGNLVFNDQLVSLRFTFQSPPFCPQLTSLKLCFVLNPYAPGNGDSLPCFFWGKKCPGPLLCLLCIGIKKKEMENLLKLAQWSNIAREKANVYCVRMVLSYLINAN